MQVNFEIVDNSALSAKGRHIDLHNNFDFEGFKYESGNREFTVLWKRSAGKWIQASELSAINLVHKGVSYLSIIDRNKDFNEAWTCLGDLTYYPSVVRHENESILNQARPNEGDDIIYSFESQQIIRVNCEEIELVAIEP